MIAGSGFLKARFTLICLLAGTLIGCEERARRAASDTFEVRNHSSSTVPATTQEKAQLVSFQRPKIEPRHIIFEAELNLVVTKLTDTETQINKVLKQLNGYVADSSVNRLEGEKLTGHWKVRIPVANYDSFIDQVATLGVAESRRQTAQDVSEEYVDVEAQITNKKKLEERIVALLKESNSQIKDIIEVEHELARVRGEIETMEGRLRYLSNRTEFSTVSITAREEQNYVPPAAPSFKNRIAQAWTLSVTALRDSAERLTVAAVYVAPWIAVAAVLLIPIAFIVRKRKRQPAEPVVA
jgi:uncharacterized coiled-coil protein SlyX